MNTKNLSRVPRSLSEHFNFDLIKRSFEEMGSVMIDLVVFLSNNQIKDLFGDVRFSLDDFCKTMGYDRTKLQRKLTKKQVENLFGKEKPILLIPMGTTTSPYLHEIETVFEAALYKLGKENFKYLMPNSSGGTSYYFVQIIKRFDINFDIHTKKKTKRTYTVALSDKTTASLFTQYNLIELNDYKQLPDRTGFRYFYLNLTRMISLIKYKIQTGQDANFLITVDQLASIFDIEAEENKERKRRVTEVLNTVNKYLETTKFQFEFVKNGGKYAYTVKFFFSNETLDYFDEKYRAIFTTKFYEKIVILYAQNKYNSRDYEAILNRIKTDFDEERNFLDWINSTDNMKEKQAVYRDVFQFVHGKLPEEMDMEVKFVF